MKCTFMSGCEHGCGLTCVAVAAHSPPITARPRARLARVGTGTPRADVMLLVVDQMHQPEAARVWVLNCNWLHLLVHARPRRKQQRTSALFGVDLQYR